MDIPVRMHAGSPPQASTSTVRTTAGIALFAAALGSGEVCSAPEYGICASQIHEYVSSRLGQEIVSIDFDYISDRGGRGNGLQSSALVYTKECPGYHLFDVRATDYDCEHRAHYGTPPNYIRYRVSGDGC